MLKNFIVNKTKSGAVAIEILFDFMVIAAVTLIFNGFILNSNNAPIHQKYFMIFNAGLITTYWYSYSFFKQRFEKDNLFFRFFTLLKITTLAFIVVGLDLLVFRLNALGINKIGQIKDQAWIERIALLIWVSGYFLSRFISLVEYLLCIYANKDFKNIVILIKGKCFSRLIVSLIAIIHFILLLLGFSVGILTYIFMPLYLMTEFLGNIAFVNDKNLQNTPKLSILYASQRYKKLTYLYIGSMFISGTVQFAYYLRNEDNLYMIGRLLAIYFIGFLMWWFYTEYSYKLIIKQKAKNLITLAFLNIFVTSSIAVLGSALINSHNNINAYYIMIAAPVGLSVFLICQNIFLNSLEKSNEITILNFKKQSWIGCVINVMISISYIIACVLINSHTSGVSPIIPIWTIYILISFVLMNTVVALQVFKRRYCKMNK